MHFDQNQLKIIMDTYGLLQKNVTDETEIRLTYLRLYLISTI